MLRLFIGILISLFLIAPVQATEEDVQAAYQAYRDAQRSGDLRAALPHAQTALDAAVLEWGYRSPETYAYLATVARLKNDLLQFEDALETLDSVLAADQGDEPLGSLSYDLYFQMGRAERGSWDHDASEANFSIALQIAEDNFGPDSEQAGFALLELSRSYTDYSRNGMDDPIWGRLIGSGRPQSSGDRQALARARSIFESSTGNERQLHILDVVQAGHLMAQNNMDAAGEVLEPAVQNLVDMGYMDDFVLNLYVDWIASYLPDWPTRRMERMLLQAMDYGKLRTEGRPLPIARGTTVRGRRACIDDLSGRYAIVEYSVNAEGRVPRTAIIETDRPRRWDDPQREMMRHSWIFIPAQQGGESVRIDGLRHHAVFGTSSSC